MQWYVCECDCDPRTWVCARQRVSLVRAGAVPGLIVCRGLRSDSLELANEGAEHSADICISAVHFEVLSPLLLFRVQERARLLLNVSLVKVFTGTASRTSSHLFTLQWEYAVALCARQKAIRYAQRCIYKQVKLLKRAGIVGKQHSKPDLEALGLSAFFAADSAKSSAFQDLLVVYSKVFFGSQS
jgi:hypothetical protein